jgi:hypothetical protein
VSLENSQNAVQSKGCLPEEPVPEEPVPEEPVPEEPVPEGPLPEEPVPEEPVPEEPVPEEPVPEEPVPEEPVPEELVPEEPVPEEPPTERAIEEWTIPREYSHSEGWPDATLSFSDTLSAEVLPDALTPPPEAPTDAQVQSHIARLSCADIALYENWGHISEKTRAKRASKLASRGLPVPSDGGFISIVAT